MPQYATQIRFNVVYRADDDEALTRTRARRLANEMLVVLQRSPKIKVVAIEPAEVEFAEQEDE